MRRSSASGDASSLLRRLGRRLDVPLGRGTVALDGTGIIRRGSCILYRGDGLNTDRPVLQPAAAVIFDNLWTERKVI